MSIRNAMISHLARRRNVAIWASAGVAALISVGQSACGSKTDAGIDAGSTDSGSECQRNADCIDSAAGRLAITLRCALTDLYCLEGQCIAECGKRCQTALPDQNPCTDGRLCAPLGNSDTSFCSRMPIKCASAADCPLYLPMSKDGSQVSWGCEEGICRYPGWTYATE